MKATQKISKRKLSDDVLERLMELIQSGQYEAGDLFPSERELMERFGVGRPAVREAMQSLQNAGLITVQQGHRPKVTAPTANGIISQIDIAAQHLLRTSPSSLEHLKDARLLFEKGVVRRAAEQVTDEHAARMRAALDAQEKYYLTEPDKFVEADIAFHIAIAETTGNPILVATEKAMLGWLKQYNSKIVRLDGKEHITLDEHRKIYEYIVAHDAEGAAYAMADHLNRSRVIFQNTDDSA
ncbi:transcriptional regulator NanR [Marinihelvus fidelis]|uniref:Transcriptional regulator NanR n=1 Tax=Marinihelvus fidelis TaxID=2613842 RepID=A0A5N0T9W8_9GAMM|nr:transcriptional regulator NanR [Marinihelvus fidelis]KAA9131561.1 transcriptional regulator NanR [Marinihelvus fidelis]